MHYTKEDIMKISIFILLLTIKTIFANTDSLMLLQIKNLNHKIKNNWSSNIPLTKWKGVTVNENKRITELYFLFQNISNLPEDIDKLSELRILNLRNNPIKKLPNSINKLSNLVNLNLTGTNILHLPLNFEELRNLRVLHLSDLKPFTLNLKLMPKLDTLTLSKYYKNCLQGLESSNLKLLYFEGNEITSFPNELLKLHNLQKLAINFTSIKKIPNNIYKLKSLKVLELRSNNLTYIPPTIRNLKYLECLDIGANAFTTLPKEISQIKNLNKLIVLNNYLHEDNLHTDVIKTLNRLHPNWREYQY